MGKYVIRPCERVGNTKIPLFALAIDDVCGIDEFEALIKKEGTYVNEIDSLYAIVEQTCNMLRVSKNNWKELRLEKKIPYKVYEARSRNLRMYLIHEEKTGRVVIYGGKKTNQDSDIKRIKKMVTDIERTKLTIESKKK